MSDEIILPIVRYSTMTLIVGRRSGGTWAYKLKSDEISPEVVEIIEARQKEGGWNPLAFGVFDDVGNKLLKLKGVRI